MKKYLDKYVLDRDKNLKYDFMPSMIEIIEKPENMASKVLIILIIMVFVTTLVWACFFKIDIVVSCAGYVTYAEGEMSNIIATTSGKINEIFFYEGDSVNTGDIIFAVDSDDIDVKLKELEDNKILLSEQKEVYETILDNEDSENSIEEVINIDNYSNKIIINSIITEELLYENQLDEYELSGLYDNNNVRENEKESFILNHRLSVIQKISSIDLSISDIDNDIFMYEKEKENRQIRALTDGIIGKMTDLKVGQNINEGEAYGFIIPSEGEMIISGYISGSDINEVNLGDEVKIRLDMYKGTDEEIITGTVSKIDNVTTNVDGLGAVYPVEISIDEDLDLKVGNMGTIDVIVGKRSVMDYFIDPFKRGLRDSLHER